MAISTSLSDVVRQLQQNKKSTDETSNSVKSLVATIREQMEIDILARADQAKRDIENQRELINAMKGGAKPAEAPAPTSPQGGGVDLNFGLAALAATAGAIVGAIRGHLKAIQTVVSVVGDIAKALWNATKGVGTIVADTWRFIKSMSLLPEGLTKQVDAVLDIMRNSVGRVTVAVNGVFDSISTRFNSVLEFVTTKADNAKGFLGSTFDNVVKWFDESIALVKGIFTISEESAIGKVVTNLKSALDTFMSPIKAASEWLFSFIGKTDDGPGFLKTIFDTIGKHIGSMGAIFRTASTVLEKIFWPLGVVMAAIDTIKGAIEGYAEDGIFGALQGAIDGLFASLIGEPLDLIKDIASWALEKLGFENASKWLDSFSFTEMFDTITDKLFGGIGKVVTFVGDLFVNMKDLIVSIFDLEITKVVNGFKIAFQAISAFIANIPDQLYLMISKNLRFGMPEIKIPIPSWLGGGDFTLLSGFEVGVGDAQTQAQAESRIAERNTSRDAEITRLNDEILAKTLEVAENWSKLSDQFRSSTVVVQDNSASVQTTNNSGAMVKIDSSIPAHNVSWMMRQGRLPNYFAQ